jgi:hypothetical protein
MLPMSWGFIDMLLLLLAGFSLTFSSSSPISVFLAFVNRVVKRVGSRRRETPPSLL